MRNLTEKPFYDVIKQYDHWIVLFRERQVTLGSLIIMSKSLDSASLGDISADAWAEFGGVCHDVESWLKTAFGAEKFNYLALMMRDPEVHFHVIPRYSRPVDFAGQTFVDPDWPEATKKQNLTLDQTVLQQIQSRICMVASP